MNMRLHEIVAGAVPQVETPVEEPKHKAAAKRSAPKRKQGQQRKTTKQQPKQNKLEKLAEKHGITPELERDSHPRLVGNWALENLPDEVGVLLLGPDPDAGKAWVWLEFPDKPGEYTRALLKVNGFRWVRHRGMWAHACGNFTRRGKQDPRQKYAAYALREEDED